MGLAFVPRQDQHLSASLRIGDVAGKTYSLLQMAELARFPESVQAELRDAHAAMNRAAMALIDISIAKNTSPADVSHYTAMAAQAADGAA
jgi:hypothetical protein